MSAGGGSVNQCDEGLRVLAASERSLVDIGDKFAQPVGARETASPRLWRSRDDGDPVMREKPFPPLYL